MREYQVRICERLGVQFPGPTGKGGYRGRVDGRAGLPSAAEMPFALEQLRLVPKAALKGLPSVRFSSPARKAKRSI